MTDEPTTIEEWESTTKDNSTLMEACLERKEGGDIEVWIRVADKIEDFFSNTETGQSNNWKADGDYHEYYNRQYQRHDGSEIQKFFENRVDSYGAEYVDNEQINCGLLRTVGLSDDEGKRFTIPSRYSGETLEESLDKLEEVVVEIYKEFIQPVTVVSKVTTYEEVK